jgi:nitrogen regulatory protein PII-like uncharacterized protein
MSLIDKAKELSGQAVEKVGESVSDLGGDDLIVNTIIRTAEKQERINRLLEEQGCNYRITGIDVENSIPPKAVFSLSRIDES